MFITFSVDDKLVTVDYDTAVKSQLINDVVSISTNSNNIIVFPNKYLQVAHNYIDFLNGKLPHIHNDKTLQLCFEMESYFHDSNYFEYLIGVLLMNWDQFSTLVYGKLSMNIVSEIFLHCPLDYIPITYLKNTTFIKQWLKLNQTNKIMVNMSSQQYCVAVTKVDGCQGTDYDETIINSYCYNESENK